MSNNRYQPPQTLFNLFAKETPMNTSTFSMTTTPEYQLYFLMLTYRLRNNELDQKNSYYCEFDETLLLKATVENLQLELQKKRPIPALH